jgi:hypothetical protein
LYTCSGSETKDGGGGFTFYTCGRDFGRTSSVVDAGTESETVVSSVVSVSTMNGSAVSGPITSISSVVPASISSVASSSTSANSSSQPGTTTSSSSTSTTSSAGGRVEVGLYKMVRVAVVLAGAFCSRL